MASPNTTGYATAIAGGLGLGLLLGSEFSGIYATLAGAALTLITIAILTAAHPGNRTN